MRIILALFGGALACLLFILIFVIPFTGLHYVTTEGEHVGYVTAVEKDGLIFKTYTAYVKSDVQSSQEEAYCVIDEAVVGQLRTAASERVRVRLGYFSYFASGIVNCAGEGAIISSVEAFR